MMMRKDLVKSYLDFFKKKKHHQIPSSSLIPENDASVLFTTAGMQQFVPFLFGEKHPKGKRIVSLQKCLRTRDIDDVGNKTHHTFFEMLGNWSLGDYWKEDAIKFSFEFLTKVLKIPVERLAVSCFEGDGNVGRDEESAEVWRKLGIKDERIIFLPKSENWWIAGDSGPCGPDTEMFYWNSKEQVPENFEPEDKRWVEIWNDVFMSHNKINGNYEDLEQKNVDTGMGVERVVAVLNGLDDNYLSEIFKPIIEKIEEISGREYGVNENETKAMRIIADHVRASVFIMGDECGMPPSNLGRGYVLRRLIRRAVRYGRVLNIEKNFLVDIGRKVLEIYPEYQELHRNHKFIFEELDKEEEKFRKTLEKGFRKFNEVARDKIITGKEAFLLFQSFGFPIEMTQELANEIGARVDLEEYNEEFRKHQDLSRTASAGEFKSGLADDSEKTKKLHTVTHLLLEALKKVLGRDVKQRGSNINSERSRFDFSFDRKLTDEEREKVEVLVNEKVSQGLEVRREEMPLETAFDSGAQGEFGAKYPDVVSVYTIVDEDEKDGFFSKEICTGPHVSNTGEIGRFRIVKEQSVSSGVRRIKSVVE